MSLTKAGSELVLLLLLVASVWAEEAGNVILDQYGSWRMFHVLKSPEIAFDDGVKPVVYSSAHYWINGETPPPPQGWTRPEFNDADWLRGPLGMGCHAPFVARACLRGRFLVADPEQVKSLKCRAIYQGGAVVFLNGQEIDRKDIASGAHLAEAYPVETFVRADGTLLLPEGDYVKAGPGKWDRFKVKKPDKEDLRRMALRQRTLEVELPARLLRKGVNVLAVEIIRAPYHKILEEEKSIGWDKEPLHFMRWHTCELIDARLTADGNQGLEPDVAWPVGLQVWNGSLLRTDFQLDFAAASETLRPITFMAARNGVFSDKVVVGLANPIRGLQAVPSELTGAGGTIPASALRVRYAMPGAAEYGIFNATYGQGSGGTFAGAMNVLFDAPSAVYEVFNPATAERGTSYRFSPARSANATLGELGKARFAPGAVAPVWLTVSVPADAKPGVYEGKLALSCEGEKSVDVPVRLEVADWMLHAPETFKTWVELVQSPDTLQLEYGVSAWSDKHFELIARSFRLMREVGSGVLYLPLICSTNYGNEESIVRWVKKGENDYDFDFTAMDKYLEVAQKNLGKPKIVCFVVWDLFLLSADDVDESEKRPNANLGLFKTGRPTGPIVTLTTPDPATGKLATATFPNKYFRNEGIKTLWKRLFGQLRERMKKRGMEDAMMIGWFSDYRARNDEIGFWGAVTGNLPWVTHSHYMQYYASGKWEGKAGYMTSIHDANEPGDPAVRRAYGWKNPRLHAQQLLRALGQNYEMDAIPGTMWQNMTEVTLAGGQRGFGRIGGDTWHVIKDKKGKRVARAFERYPWSIWNNLELAMSFLAPGPEGAVATAHFEQFREGVQMSEARIYIEDALTDAAKRRKLGDDLAQECQATLDERLLCNLRGMTEYGLSGGGSQGGPWEWKFHPGVTGHAWFQSSGWRQRSAGLYALAAEVGRALGQEAAGTRPR